MNTFGQPRLSMLVDTLNGKPELRQALSGISTAAQLVALIRANDDARDPEVQRFIRSTEKFDGLPSGKSVILELCSGIGSSTAETVDVNLKDSTDGEYHLERAVGKTGDGKSVETFDVSVPSGRWCSDDND